MLHPVVAVVLNFFFVYELYKCQKTEDLPPQILKKVGTLFRINFIADSLMDYMGNNPSMIRIND